MANYSGKLTGAQIDALPDDISELSEKVGDFSTEGHEALAPSVEILEDRIKQIDMVCELNGDVDDETLVDELLG